jgi:nucleotide-binding universal stress UspA family protein
VPEKQAHRPDRAGLSPVVVARRRPHAEYRAAQIVRGYDDAGATRSGGGVDGSDYSRAALTYAMEEAARRGTGVQVVSAFLPPQYRPDAYGLTAPPTPDEIRSDLRLLARRMVDEVVAEVPALAAVPVELHELEGKPAEVLNKQARGAGLLVVGHRGRGGVASALLGSVSLECVLHAECPVTVIRPKPQPEVVRDPDTAAKAHDRHRVQLVDRTVAPPY